MHSPDPRVDMLLRRPAHALIPRRPPLLAIVHPFHRNEHAISIRMQEVRKGIAIQTALSLRGDDSVPRALELSGGPELQHVANVDQDLVRECGRGSPCLGGERRGGRRVVRRSDFETANGGLEEEGEGPPVGMGRDAECWDASVGICFRCCCDRRVVHQLEVVEVFDRGIVVLDKRLTWEMEGQGDQLEQLPREALNLLLEGTDLRACFGKDRWKRCIVSMDGRWPFVDTDCFAWVCELAVRSTKCSWSAIRCRPYEAWRDCPLRPPHHLYTPVRAGRFVP